MIPKTIPTVHRFIPFLFALICVSIFPLFAHADVVQPDHSEDTSNIWNESIMQGLGTGLEGTISAGSGIWFNSPGGSPGAANYSIRAFDTEAAYQECIDAIDCGSTPGVDGFVGNTNISMSGVSSGIQFRDSSTGFSFNPAYWYVLRVGATNWYNPEYALGSATDTYANGYCFVFFDNGAHPSCDGVADLNFTFIGVTNGGGGDACESGYTRICGFTPENGEVLTGPDIEFTLKAWIDEQDVSGDRRVRIRLHNIDQNVLLLGFFSNNDIWLLDEKLEEGESGEFNFATTTPLADGNYRIEAWLTRTVFFGWIKNPFDNNADQVISKQFIVGAPTFIGNLTQNGFNILNGTMASSTATSSLALVAQCSPFADAGFNMVNCLSGLLIPDSNQIQQTIQGARDGILSRLPWGYFTRFAEIMSNTATSTLPSWNVTVALNNADDTTNLAFNPAEMLAGGAALVDTIADPYYGKTARDIFEPMIQLSVAFMVILTLAADITSSHKHDSSPGDVAARRKKK